jgi:glycine cleavage system pyridoxal-binding protein P
VNTPENATKLVGRMADQNVAAGIPLSDTELLVAVTEMNTKADIDTLVERLRRAS